MSKYRIALADQIDNLLAFAEVYLIRRKLTAEEAANMREIINTIAHTAQADVIEVIAEELKNNLNEDTAPMVSKLGAILEGFYVLRQKVQIKELINLSIQKEKTAMKQKNLLLISVDYDEAENRILTKVVQGPLKYDKAKECQNRCNLLPSIDRLNELRNEFL